jgi:hypothetical protein
MSIWFRVPQAARSTNILILETAMIRGKEKMHKDLLP